MDCQIIPFPAGQQAARAGHRRRIGLAAEVASLVDYRLREARRRLRYLADLRRERETVAARIERLGEEGSTAARSAASSLAVRQFRRNLKNLGAAQDAEAALGRLTEADAAQLRQEAASWA